MSKKRAFASLGLVAAAAAMAVAMMVGLTQPVTTAQPAASPVAPKDPVPVWTPQFMTGYEPDETRATGTDTIDWMVFDNTSTHADAIPWAMTVFYETPGTTADRWARLIDDPTEPGNTVLAFWLKNAVIETGYPPHTKGRVQTKFPGALVDAVEVWSSQRVFLPEDWNLLNNYPPDGDPFWLSAVLEEFWFGAPWEGHPNAARINLNLYAQGGKLRLSLRAETMPDMGLLWQATSPRFEMPVGEWVTIEVGYKMGNAQTGRMVVIVTNEATGARQVLFDVTNWTYSPLADEPGGTGPVPLIHWDAQKVYSSDNIIHFIRDSGGVAQAYFDDFAFSGEWPPNWP
jgi:hypothetical protein